ncbi:hypothetical protein V495_00890 [Pseudogymnoascus sp. VKM F-4514 (FW-929)]|nr:hypothetical protein V495_00890 [Pseudogymnoascus sp. VKM F-4514 (FW-929)]KFY57630.1 hypothetical protein V497_05385 [Pseudogymnoascus sp. VKM F-4516 (FW-969)]
MEEKKSAIRVIPDLYLSSFPNELDKKYTHVLNMCMTPHKALSHASHPPESLHLKLLDWDDITPYIPQILMYITTVLENPQNRVLVHCVLGVNRSAAAVIAYLCHRNGSNATTALEYLKGRKLDVQPSAMFLQQIDKYFGYKDTFEVDPMVAFHERLRKRKAGK